MNNFLTDEVASSGNRNIVIRRDTEINMDIKSEQRGTFKENGKKRSKYIKSERKFEFLRPVMKKVFLGGII